MDVLYSTMVANRMGCAEAAYPLESSLHNEPMDKFQWLAMDRLYSRILCDTAWSMCDCQPAGLIVVDRSEVPDSIISPPWPIDVALDMKTKTTWISHVPRGYEWYDSWQKRNIKHLDVLFDLSERIEGCLPVLELGQIKLPTPFTVDWIRQAGERAYMRLETYSGSRLQWIRAWCSGTISKMPAYCPLIVFECQRSINSIRMVGIEENDVLEITNMRSMENEIQV